MPRMVSTWTLSSRFGTVIQPSLKTWSMISRTLILGLFWRSQTQGHGGDMLRQKHWPWTTGQHWKWFERHWRSRDSTCVLKPRFSSCWNVTDWIWFFTPFRGSLGSGESSEFAHCLWHREITCVFGYVTTNCCLDFIVLTILRPRIVKVAHSPQLLPRWSGSASVFLLGAVWLDDDSWSDRHCILHLYMMENRFIHPCRFPLTRWSVMIHVAWHLVIQAVLHLRQRV